MRRAAAAIAVMAHLHRYVDEFAYRYNTRGMTDGQRLIDTVVNTQGRRLMYREPIAE